MKFELFVFLVLISTVGYSQEYVVETVELIETVDNTYVSDIPRVRDLENENNQIVESINSRILDRFMINSFTQSELEQFRWYDVVYTSEFIGNILHISFSGEYYGASLNGIHDNIFFSLKSGESLTTSELPSEAIFFVSDYFDFFS